MTFVSASSPAVPPVPASPVASGRRRPWWLSVAGGAAVVVFGGLGAAGMWRYVNHDRLELLDLPVVVDAASAGCAQVTAALSGVVEDPVGRVVAGNAAIVALTDGVEGLGADTLADDAPAREWLEDWATLAAARQATLSPDGTGVTGAFVMPLTDDGFPIVSRMVDAAPPVCEEAVTLASTLP